MNYNKIFDSSNPDDKKTAGFAPVNSIVIKFIWKFDLFIYKLFFWRWERRLKKDRDLARLFETWITTYNKQNPL